MKKTIELKSVWLTRSFRRCSVTSEEETAIRNFIQENKGQAGLHVQLETFPKAFWRAVLDEPNLGPSARAAITLYLFGMSADEPNLDAMYNMSVGTPSELGNALQVAAKQRYVCETSLNGRWYPIPIGVSFNEDSEKTLVSVTLSAAMILSDRTIHRSTDISREYFVDEVGEAREFTVLEILEKEGFRRLQTSAGEFNLRLVRAERMANESGQVVSVSNSVVTSNRTMWWRSMVEQPLGTPESPACCVVDSDLEVEGSDRHYHHHYSHGAKCSPLPFVRVFSLETKDYVYADIDDIEYYDFDTEAMARLHLPNQMHSILQRVFETPIDKMFGDVLKGKHGGVVVLASGQPGVGKTLTAEIYAECTRRPLYVLELGELGTKAAEVEENLQLVFARVTRWNAVLQFDECEIFLAKRGEDLERSAIVGIFLRLLDYYRGLLFLTTNRPEVLDDAVLSRIMLRLEYPNLTAENRARVWQTMFEQANLRLEGTSFSDVGSQLDINGRQIRNLTRLAKILNEDGIVDKEGFQELVFFGVGHTNSLREES